METSELLPYPAAHSRYGFHFPWRVQTMIFNWTVLFALARSSKRNSDRVPLLLHLVHYRIPNPQSPAARGCQGLFQVHCKKAGLLSLMSSRVNLTLLSTELIRCVKSCTSWAFILIQTLSPYLNQWQCLSVAP